MAHDRDKLEASILGKHDNHLTHLTEYRSNEENFNTVMPSDKDFHDLQHLLRVAQSEHLLAHNTFEDLRYQLTHMTNLGGRGDILTPLHADEEFKHFVAQLEACHKAQGEHIAKLRGTFNEAARLDLLRDSVKNMLNLIDSVEGKLETLEELRASIMRTVKRRSKLLDSVREANRALLNIETGQRSAGEDE